MQIVSWRSKSLLQIRKYSENRSNIKYQEPTNYENCDMFIEIWLSKPTDVRTDEYAVHRSFIITSRRHGSLNDRHSRQKISNRCPRYACQTWGLVEKNTQQRTGVSLDHNAIQTVKRRTRYERGKFKKLPVVIATAG